MSVRHVVTVYLAAILLMSMCRVAYSQSLVPGGFFRDDFEDGNSRDSEPAKWRRGVWDAEKDEVIDGDLHIVGSRDSSVFAVDPNGAWLSYEDSVVIAQMRILKAEGRGLVGLYARSGPVDAYFGGIDTSGLAFVGGPTQVFTDSVSTEIDPVSADFMVQLELTGDEIGLTVWGEGEPKPATPQLTFVDEELTSGAFGAFVISLSGSPVDAAIRWIEVSDDVPPPPTPLRAGDADQDFDFDQLDLVQVSQVGKYLTGQAATWGEGDWDGAPGGAPGDPPTGNAVFDQFDIISALAAGVYLTGPYWAITGGGAEAAGQPSVSNDAGSSKVGTDAPDSTARPSALPGFADSIATNPMIAGPAPGRLRSADSNIFHTTFPSRIEALRFGNVAHGRLSQESWRDDLPAVASLAGGGDLAAADLIYVPEPTSFVLVLVGLILCGAINGTSRVSRRSPCRS